MTYVLAYIGVGLLTMLVGSRVDHGERLSSDNLLSILVLTVIGTVLWPVIWFYGIRWVFTSPEVGEFFQRPLWGRCKQQEEDNE